MSLPAVKTKTKFINPPIDGLNLISDPASFSLTQARTLDNYYIYDWGIRERAAAIRLDDLPDGGYPIQMFSFTSAGLNKQYTLISTSMTNIYLYDGSVYSSWHAGTNFAGACAFNKYIILPQGGAAVVSTLRVTDGARTAAAFVTTGNALGAFVYKNRVYIWKDGRSDLDYGGVGAVAGAVTNLDFSQFFQKGQKIVFGCSWTYNQGVINDDLFVVGNEMGEVLIYSGDNPTAANWQLLTRLEIPAPLSVPGFTGLTNVLKIGQDILINTARGVISLASVLAGRDNSTGYYAVSRNLGPVLSGAQMDFSTQVPFAYFGANWDVYVLNYERGAWSKFPQIVTGNDYITCISCQTPGLTSTYAPNLTSYVLIGAQSGKIYKISETSTGGTTATSYTWETPYYDLGTPLVKNAHTARLIARDMGSSSVYHSATVSAEFDDNTPGQSDTATKTVTDQSYVVQQLVLPQVGKWLSYNFTKTGSPSTMNEIAGLDVVYSEGGLI